MFDKDSVLLIKKYLEEFSSVEEYCNSNTIYKQNIKIAGEHYNVGGIFFEDKPNLIANYIINNYDIDILFLINLKNKITILRKNGKVKIDLSKLAKQLSKGGGNDKIAGCLLNDNIMNLTKNLKPIE